MNSNSEERKTRSEDDDDAGNPCPSPNTLHRQIEQEISRELILFGLIGATATTLAFIRSVRSSSSRKGAAGGSFWTSFQEEASRRYNRRMQEEWEEEMERVERIRRMQSVFNRKRENSKRSYDTWMENGQSAYHQQFQREDWYWKTDASYRDQRTNFKETPRERPTYILSHHYSILGLDRLRLRPYSDDEIKTAFRSKAKEFHPDQNQDNKELAEAKFKEVMTSYEAIKKERKNDKQ